MTKPTADRETPSTEGRIRAPRRPRRSMVLMRQVPGTSVVHRLWAGTKLIAVFAFVLTLTFSTSWAAIGLSAALLVLTALLARIPRGAVPRVPVWFWIAILIGGVLSTPAGGNPELIVGSWHLGIGALLIYLRLTTLSLVLLVACAMVTWTTALSDIAPAVAKLGAPLRRLRIPVDEWSVAIALSLRSLPLLLEELRVLMAARRLRPRPPRRTLASAYTEVIDLATAALSVSLRRASELGEAITARGGTGQLTAHPSGPGWNDAVALTLVVVVCTATFVAPAML